MPSPLADVRLPPMFGGGAQTARDEGMGSYCGVYKQIIELFNHSSKTGFKYNFSIAVPGNSFQQCKSS